MESRLLSVGTLQVPLTEGDIQVEDDIFLIATHSHKDNPAHGIPSVLPPILAEADPGGDGHGVGVNEH